MKKVVRSWINGSALVQKTTWSIDPSDESVSFAKYAPYDYIHVYNVAGEIIEVCLNGNLENNFYVFPDTDVELIGVSFSTVIIRNPITASDTAADEISVLIGKTIP